MRGLGGREKGWGLNLPDNICILNANIRKIYAFQTQILKYPAFNPLDEGHKKRALSPSPRGWPTAGGGSDFKGHNFHDFNDSLDFPYIKGYNE